MKKLKVLLTSVCAVLLVAASVFGTMAYLTSRDTVTNTFTVGQVDIIVDETDVDLEGNPIAGASRVEENDYHLLPGSTYTKDPRMTVLKGSEESYVRMVVTINCYKELAAIFGDPFLPQYLVSGWDNNTWKTQGMEVDTATNTATYEFRYKTTVEPTADADLVLEPLFETLTIPGTVTGSQLKTLLDKDLTVTVVGHAIQAANLATEDIAWAAFDAQPQD